MFSLFRKKQILQYAEQAREYLAKTLVPDTPEPPVRKAPANDVQYSARSSSNDVLYSVRGGTDDVRYSARGCYDDVFSEKSSYLIDRYGINVRALQNELNSVLSRTFAETLADHIQNKALRDTEVYKAAQIDRRLFSKIMSDRSYKPSRDTAIALAFALELTADQAKDLLSRAGHALSHSSARDVIIEYFFVNGIYNLNDVNDVLYTLGQKTLGR